MQNDTCYILALIKRDDGERLLLGSGFYEFTKEQKHFNPNLFANDVVELQGADGQLLAGQVRRSTAQSFDGYIGDGTTSKQIVEQKRREFFLFFRKQHHYTVVYIMPDGTAIKRDRGYIVDAPAVQELYQVQPKWHVSLAFEDVNYYSYAEDSQGHEIYAFSADLNLASVLGGGLKWDANGAISGSTGLANIRVYGKTSQKTYQGYNVLNVVPIGTASQGITATANSDGTITVSGTCTSTWANISTRSTAIAIPAGTYTLQTTEAHAGFGVSLRLYQQESGGTYVDYAVAKNTTSKTFTIGDDMKSGYVWLSGTTATQQIDETFGIQLVAGTVPAPFEPYVGAAPAPNPDFPQPIQTVTGEHTVTVGGTNFPLTLKSKNLFDKNNIKELAAYVNANGNLTSGSGTMIAYIRCKANTTYTVSKTNTGTNQRFCVFDIASRPVAGKAVLSTVGTRSGLDTAASYTITTGATAKFLGVFYRVSSTTPSKQDILDTIQIEENSTATAYAPYLNIELCPIAGHLDYIYKNGQTWTLRKGTAKMIADENTTVTAAQYGTNPFELLLQPLGMNHFQDRCVYSDYFGAVAYEDRTVVQNNIVYMNTRGSDTYAYLRNTAWTSVAELTEWLGDNTPSFYYSQNGATTSAITDATLIAQLNAIEEAMGADGQPTAIVPTGQNLAAIITGEPNGTGGYEWEASEGGGPSFITVEGVDDALPVWHVVGPATNPTLTNSSNGLSITWNGTVPAGQELIVDMGAQTATMEGANVFQYISGSWLTLSPGTNRIAYTAANTTAGSKIYWNEIVG